MYDIDINQYRGYLLDDSMQNFELTSNEKKLLDACVYLVDNRCAIRCAASNCDVAKSTLHHYIHTKLKSISFELYQCVKHTLYHNQSHRR